MQLFMFIVVYCSFMILILSFSNVGGKIRHININPSLLTITAFGLSLVSLTVFLVNPIYALIGGIIAIILGIFGIIQVYVYPEITTGYVQASLAIITGITIILMYISAAYNWL